MKLVALSLQCKPFSYFWEQVLLDPAIQGVCVLHTMTIISYIYTASALICDLTLGIVPIFLVKKLQMAMVTKVAVAAILSLGVL
ncbi:hypothetical protein BJY04DRAFT_192740 [Aspergillus karnatakaensis]|uniref:uncharacterized protein n=1 Tax=Aspergillus karnatakaensis TaxID=1810916 RepID=UPI003CCCDD8D